MNDQMPWSDGEHAIDVALQGACLEIWKERYRLVDGDGTPLESSPADTLDRTADALAQVETTASNRNEWRRRFRWAIKHGAVPAGRIIANAGVPGRAGASLVNCTVSGTIDNSTTDVLSKVREAGITLQAGCGVGHDFSTLCPRGAANESVGCPGPLAFMEVFDAVGRAVSAAGRRRGAQMATLYIGHPDIVDFIQAKRQTERFQQFNLSVLVCDDFMRACAEDQPWPLAFPLTKREARTAAIDLEDPARVVWRRFGAGKGHLVDHRQRVACRIYRTVPARWLWRTITLNAYYCAEPGVVYIDRYNDMNNNWFCETIHTTNPCGEQGLPPYGACLLGSVNLTRLVFDPFSAKARFDWERFRKVVHVFTRMLDNVVELHALPLAPQGDQLLRTRRHGMGFLGLGSTLTMLGVHYGSPHSVRFTEHLSRELALCGWRAALALAREKGPAPIMHERFVVTPEMLSRRPEMQRDGIRAGDRLPGRVLHARYSRYMQRIAQTDARLVGELAETGARFTHHSAIAPTGTISLAFANNASNGIEPSYAHHYARKVLHQGAVTTSRVDVYSHEYLVYRARLCADGDCKDIDDQSLPETFVNATEIRPESHLAIQAAAQKWIDASISKTVNVATDCSLDDFALVYQGAYDIGLKGCAAFRLNPAALSPVLIEDAGSAGLSAPQ